MYKVQVRNTHVVQQMHYDHMQWMIETSLGLRLQSCSQSSLGSMGITCTHTHTHTHTHATGTEHILLLLRIAQCTDQCSLSLSLSYPLHEVDTGGSLTGHPVQSCVFLHKVAHICNMHSDLIHTCTSRALTALYDDHREKVTFLNFLYM